VAPDPGGGSYRGRLYIFIAGVVLSSGGLVVRQIEAADSWQILFYRSVTQAVLLLAFLAFRDGTALAATFRQAGRFGLAGGLALGLATTGFVLSVTHTTVANTLFLLSASPLAAALLGWLLIRERVRRRTWLAMGAAAIGILVMIGDGLVAGDLFGHSMALMAVLGIAAFTVMLRWKPEVDMLTAVVLAGIFSALAAALASGGGLSVPPGDLAWCVLFGVVIVLGLRLYTAGGRQVPAAETALLSLGEVVLGPIWVWLVVGEQASLLTLVGGAVVLVAVVAQILSGGRPRRLAAPLE
jgi:drug/metabolite transporter (DMT)-like permease